MSETLFTSDSALTIMTLVDDQRTVAHYVVRGVRNVGGQEVDALVQQPSHVFWFMRHVKR